MKSRLRDHIVYNTFLVDPDLGRQVGNYIRSKLELIKFG